MIQKKAALRFSAVLTAVLLSLGAVFMAGVEVRAASTDTVSGSTNTTDSISLTNPAYGATVSGIVNLTMQTTFAISGDVRFFLATNGIGGTNGLLLCTLPGTKSSPAVYSCPWDSRSTPNGNVALTVATRPELLSRTSPVTINNPDTTPPAVTITFPAEGSMLSGTVGVTATVTDNVGVLGGSVSLYADGAFLGGPSGPCPSVYGLYCFSWDTRISISTNGAHVLSVSAADTNNNRGSASINVFVKNRGGLPGHRPIQRRIKRPR